MKPTTTLGTIVSLTVASMLLAPVAWAEQINLVENGSFEEGVDPGIQLHVPVGADYIFEWVVSKNGVDYTGTNWQAAEGVRSVDLVGEFPGMISQRFPVNVGDRYYVAFAMSGSPTINEWCTDPIKRMTVHAGHDSSYYEFDVTGHSKQDMGWRGERWSFAAQSDSIELAFEGLEPAMYCGPAVDNVRVYKCGIFEKDVALDLPIYSGDTAAGSIVLENCSNDEYLVSANYDCGWIDGPEPFTMHAGSEATVDFTVDATDLLPGQHTCNVVFDYGEPETLELPVTINVRSPFEVEVTDAPEYGRQGRRLRWEFEITNLTDQDRSVDVWFDAYLRNGSPLPSNPVLGPYTGSFAPGDVASFFAQVKIPQNAPLGSPYKICTVLGASPDEWVSDCFEFAIQP